MSNLTLGLILVFTGGYVLGWESHRKYLRKLFKLSLVIRKKLHGG